MLRTDWLKIASIVYVSFYLVGCSQVADPNVPNDTTPSPSEMAPMVPALPPQGDSTAMPPDFPTPASGPEKVIEIAKADLAQRLSISTNEINLVEASDVTWPDSSLGCPQEGMAYTQVLTPGFLVILESGGKTFEYHAGKGGTLIYCENPNPPVIGTPGNT